MVAQTSTCDVQPVMTITLAAPTCIVIQLLLVALCVQRKRLLMVLVRAPMMFLVCVPRRFGALEYKVQRIVILPHRVPGLAPGLGCM